MSECVRVEVSQQACYIAIEGGGAIAFSERTEYRTAGGARLVFDCDANHRVVGIELLGVHQNCQSVVEDA